MCSVTCQCKFASNNNNSNHNKYCTNRGDNDTSRDNGNDNRNNNYGDNNNSANWGLAESCALVQMLLQQAGDAATRRTQILVCQSQRKKRNCLLQKMRMTPPSWTTWVRLQTMAGH